MSTLLDIPDNCVDVLNQITDTGATLLLQRWSCFTGIQNLTSFNAAEEFNEFCDEARSRTALGEFSSLAARVRHTSLEMNLMAVMLGKKQ